MKVSLLFPGQGSQFVGMVDDFNRPYFEEASETLKFDLTKLASDGPEDELKKTAYTQPAIVTSSYALLTRLQTQHPELEIERVLGHSVGEYSALIAAGSLSFSQAVKAVHLRGQAMQEATPLGVGAMVAILKVAEDKIRQACQEASTADSVVTPANFNDPNQVVISGHKEACDRAVEVLKKMGPVRAIPLTVSAPFHSPLMKPAEEKMQQVLQDLEIQENVRPYIANVDAQEYAPGTSPDLIRKNLSAQICASVLWTSSFTQCQSSELCLEVGPGKVLKGLARKILPEMKVIELSSSWDELGEALS